MQVSGVNLSFAALPQEVQEKTLKLVDEVNRKHLHCEDQETWQRVHGLMVEQLARDYHEKQKKRLQPRVDPALQNAPPKPLRSQRERQLDKMTPLTQNLYNEMLNAIKKTLHETFHDPLFTDPIVEALQQHILTPLGKNFELVRLLCVWIEMNVMYLPLGTHLISAYQEDMNETSAYFKHVLIQNIVSMVPEALSEKTVAQMTAFLAEAAEAHGRSCPLLERVQEKPTAVMLSVKNGAGGHTAPTQAMAARLKERGWRVETIHYDTDLSAISDPFQLLGLTFEEGSPMTEHLFSTRWVMQNTNRKVSQIVGYYVNIRVGLDPDLFQDKNGGELLRNKVLPLNPQLFVTTLAYHWCWRSLAYRVAGAKTLLVASDVFFHQQAIKPWYRQQALAPKLWQIHFTTMTDDKELLVSVSEHHDRHLTRKFPGQAFDSLVPFYEGFHLDSQITVIGAPIHPAFEATTEVRERERLREKWRVPKEALSVCISRGKLGFEADLAPALEGYRTTERLARPVKLQVVCGENKIFYDKLVAGAYSDLGPDITVNPHPLLKPQDFAELRSISTIDDIKAGGGSTFEGWYLISKGIESMLLLTPGPTLWWEMSNCDAMEKWGVGRTVSQDTGKIAILQEVIAKGLPVVKHRFPDWKRPFDAIVEVLLKEKGGVL